MRLPLAIPVFARGKDERGKEFTEFTTALNVSAGGLLLVVRHYLPEDSQVSVEIPSAPVPPQTAGGEIIRTLPGKVVRVKNSDRFFLLGVEFAHPLILR